MTLRILRMLVCTGALICLVTFAGWSYAQKKDAARTPGELLPAEAVFYLRLDGAVGHEEAYAQTAAYQALHESGLMDVINGLVSALGENEETAGIVGILQHLQAYGISLAIAVDAPTGKPVQTWATVVVPYAAEGVDLLANVVSRISNDQIDVKQTKVKGRQIKYVKLNNELAELGWWEQGESLVLAFGMQAIANSLAVADGERPNITSHPLWERYSKIEDDFDVTQISWLDFESLRRQFGERPLPIPGQQDAAPPTINQILQIMGLNTLNHASCLSGYRGDSIWTEAFIDAPGEKSGLLTLLDQAPFTLDDLPAMPLHHLGLTAFSLNGNQVYTAILKVVRELAELGPERKRQQIEEGLAKFEAELGFAPQDLLGAIGNLHCLYTDSSQGVFGLGAVGLVNVKDQEVLTDCLRKIFNRIAEEAEKERPDSMRIRESEEEERTVFRLEFPRAPFISPTFSVGDDWLIVGLIPQAVEAQLMRIDGRLFSWSIDEDLAEPLDMFPEEITSLHVVDPAGTYKMLIGLAPTMISMMELGMKESGTIPRDGHFAIDVAAIPPAELVVQHLFMNIGVATTDQEGWHAYARQSLPGIPLVGGSVTPGVGAGAVGISLALLLPAVQQARTAARISQSKNNMKQLGLAMHNYHDVYRHFPEGTIPNSDLQQPEERLSWFVSLLPFLDQARLYNTIDQKSGWEAEDNKDELSTTVPVFLNPDMKYQGGPYGQTTYVGIGGLGEDGPILAVDDPKAGVFGFNRFTNIRDITDGTSNTMMITEASEANRWGQGGRATVRALTKKPYINGPDGIGSSRPDGLNILFADGAVRNVNANTDPAVLEAWATICGGEVVEGF